MDFLSSLLQALYQFGQNFAAFLSVPTGARAIVIGLVLGWGITQTIKWMPVLTRLPDDVERSVTRVIAFASTYVPIYLLWPYTPTDRYIGPLCALASALWSQWVYKEIVTIILHRWPWLETKISATPTRKDNGQH